MNECRNSITKDLLCFKESLTQIEKKLDDLDDEFEEIEEEFQLDYI